MTTDENLGKAAIFDLDGTLLDSMGVWDQIDAAFLAKRGITVPDDYMETVTAMQFREIARYTIDRFDLDDTEDGLMAEWDRMAHDAYTSIVQPKAHALDYLRYLKATGARLAVATTMPAGLRAPALGHAGMLDLFDAIVGVDDVGRGKEHPDIYLEAAVFEDLRAGVQSASGAGLHGWGVYDESSAQSWPAIQSIAQGVLDDFAQAPRPLA